MTKRKGLILGLVFAALMLLAGVAAASEVDPIVWSMELDPDKLAGPGTVNVTITISNSGDTDMKDPVVLYDPAAQIVSDFGTNGAVLLKAGESATWTGTYDVNDRTLENGAVVYFVKYTLYKDSGEAVDQSQPIRAAISLQTAETDIEVKRTISPTVAGEDQEVVVRYDITNSGTVDLTDVTIQENADIHKEKQTIPLLEPGKTAEVRYTVTMGKKDLTSGATITYKSETESKTQTYTVENQTITYGESSLTAKLTSDVKGVVENGTVTLSLELKNTGSVDYSDLRVTDPSLGDVFTNQQLKAGESLTLEKEITVPATAEYQFTVTATDEGGSEMSVVTEPLTVTAVAPEDALTLSVTATADRTEVFEQPGLVRFTLEIANTSQVDATDVVVSHGDTKLYTFASIPAGETRTLSRDTALSMAGKFQFTVTAKDPLESTLTFESNEIQIAFSVPTPAPATPTPPPEPTPDPTFSPATVPPITDPSVGSVPKTIQSILLPVLILAGILLIASCVLLLIATKRRADQRKASKSAIDQLERAKRRDYVTPAEEEEPEQTEETAEEVTVESKALDEDAEEDLELPHLKYARSASRPAPVEDEEDYSAIRGGLYDADLATTAAAQETDAKTEEAPGVAQKAQRKEEPQPEEKAKEAAAEPYDDGVAYDDFAAQDDAGYGEEPVAYDDGAYGEDAGYDDGTAYGEETGYADGTYDDGTGYGTYDDGTLPYGGEAAYGDEALPYDDGTAYDDSGIMDAETYDDGYGDPDASADGYPADDRGTAAQAYDDSAFRRPADEAEPTGRRRRSRGRRLDS